MDNLVLGVLSVSVVLIGASQLLLWWNTRKR